MREKTHFRSCPKCSKELGYITVYKRDYAESAGKVCMSCATTKAQTGKTRSAEARANIGAGSKAYKKSITDATTKMYGDKVKCKQLALKKWGKEVQERDDSQCQCCGKEKTTPLSMHAHHVVPSGYFPEMAFNIDNGITLCSSCHKKLHCDLNRLTMAGIKLDAEGFGAHASDFIKGKTYAIA